VIRFSRPRKEFFSLLSPRLVAKTLPRNKLGSCLSKNTPEQNVSMIQSVWRRLKKNLKEAIIRDLQPREDVKGGGGVKDQSKSNTRGSGTTRGH
jgi:hypothetical protein